MMLSVSIEMQFGFSPIGLLFLAMLFVPNILWARYFTGGGKIADMYAPLGPIPIPLASLPVVAFALLGIWYASPIAVAAAIVLGIGHIGIHLEHVRELE